MIFRIICVLIPDQFIRDLNDHYKINDYFSRMRNDTLTFVILFYYSTIWLYSTHASN